MKVKVYKTVKTEKEVDVEFPIFREQDTAGDYGPSSVRYTRIDQVGDKLREITVHTTGRKQVEIEINNDYRFDRSGMDYSLGQGEYASSREDFEKAVKQAQELLEVALNV